jgi:hypothetical protein
MQKLKKGFLALKSGFCLKIMQKIKEAKKNA